METVLACITFLKNILKEGMPMQKWLKLNIVFSLLELFLKVMSLGTGIQINAGASLLPALHF